jgi:hypothetical protein
MNANYGYQLYQAERTQTRAEILDHGHHRGPDGSRRVIMTEPTRGGTA